MRAAVTGATGFLGSHLCRRLVDDGHQVVALRRAASDAGELEQLGVETVTGDIADAGAIDALVKGCDVIFHAAGAFGYGPSIASEQERVNVQGTRTVASACRAWSRRMIHVSSVAAIGVPRGGIPMCENARFNAERLTYHRSKYEAERAVLQELDLGLDAAIINPAWMLGPWRTGYRGSELVQRVVRSPVVPCLVGGTSIVHVADVVDGALAAQRRGKRGERYILAGENLSWLAMARIASQEIGVHRVFLPLVPPPGVLGLARAIVAGRGQLRDLARDSAVISGRHQYYDSSKASAELGYAPRPYRDIVRDYLDGAWRLSPRAARRGEGRSGP